MAVTDTTRFALTQWSAGSDPPVTRAQLTGDNLTIEQKAAGWLTDTAANRPAAGASNIGFVFRATDTGALSISNGSAWFNIPIGTFLALSGGTLTGFLDLATNELRNATVVQARDKVVSASVSGAVVIDAAAAGTHILTMTGNVSSITVNNLNSGESLKIVWLEDATGSRTIQAALNAAGWVWRGGVAVGSAGFSIAANARNVLVLEKGASVVEAYLSPDMKA